MVPWWAGISRCFAFEVKGEDLHADEGRGTTYLAGAGGPALHPVIPSMLPAFKLEELIARLEALARDGRLTKFSLQREVAPAGRLLGKVIARSRRSRVDRTLWSLTPLVRWTRKAAPSVLSDMALDACRSQTKSRSVSRLETSAHAYIHQHMVHRLLPLFFFSLDRKSVV